MMKKETLHLLMLEDNPDDAELAAKALERDEFTIEWNRVDTEESFRKALDEKPDLILADYSLPTFDGMSALKIKEETAPEIPLILISGTIGEDIAVECLKAGATDYVLKDRLSRLGSVVKRALEETETYRKHKQAEKALKHKLLVLSQTVGKTGDLKLSDIIDVDILQKLQDGFAESYDIASIIGNEKGLSITKPSYFSDFCTLIRSTKKGLKRCEMSKLSLANLVSNGSCAVASCKNFNEIIEGVAPIFVEGRHIGTWGIGQKLIKRIPEDKIRIFAREIDVDEDEFVAAEKKLKIGTREQFKQIVSFLEVIANNISLLGLQNIQQAREINERMRAEEALLKSEENMRQIQKMEAIGTLAGGVAHDFNNILMAIQGNVDIALMDVQKDNPVYLNLMEIRQASERASDLTRQLLLFSRRQPMEQVPLDPNKIIKNLYKMLHRLIGEDIFLSVDPASDLKMIKGDAGTIEQAIMNLVVNARDAMEGGGKIIIKTKNAFFNEEDCKLNRDAKPGEFVCLSVHDTGDSIEPSILDRIFEPFFTTKAQGKGTGLGLSAVYGIVKKHGGWINVKSTPDDGTTFKIYLPTISLRPEQEQQPLVSEKKFKGNGERILVVEDEEVVRNLLVEMLSGKGYKVFSATNAREALDIFRKEKGAFDLVFCDVVLPDIRGPKLVEQLLKQNPGIHVLFTSGYSDEKSDWQIIQQFGYPYLQKPFTSYDMLKTVKEALER